ncbi:MAG: PAS domain S-box protein [Alphaproteobacteria bacterium]|nr:PAS domain S-box protein [Alphaproteobacteria bacterium]
MSQDFSILNAVLASSPDAMVIIDEQGVIANFSATAEAIFGHKESDVIGQNICVLMPPTYQEGHDGHIRRYLSTGERHVIGIGREVEAIKADGTVFPIELSIGEAVVDDRRYFTGFIRDLTQLRAARERIQNLQNELTHMSRVTAMGTMAASLAHELNQPLTAISNYMNTARDMIGNFPETMADELRIAFDETARAALRAGAIIHRLRDFIEKADVNMRVTSLGDIIADSMLLGALNAREKGIKVRTQLDYTGDVIADPVQVQQVIINLVRNAFEAMEGTERREITISSTTQEEFICVSVADTGCGITPTQMERLFTPFAGDKSSGMGLGLSICKTIIEAHGGQLWAESNDPLGTKFTFTLVKNDGDVIHD